ncbi:MAG: 4'-phosphopantetheinyl transferase family protein [Pseudobdellovibrionaceae bacterium]
MADAFSSLAQIDLDFLSLGQAQNSYTLVTAAFGHLKPISQDVVDQILHRDEVKIYNDIKDRRRRYQFLMGRYAAKRNLGWNVSGFHMSDVAILGDPLGKPTIKANTFLAVGVSISHVDNLAVALVGPKSHIGIDIEVLRKSLVLIGPTVLSECERNLMSEFSFSQEGEMEGIVWSAKEAASKFLGTGINGSLSQFAISACQQLGQGQYRFSFIHFPAVQSYSYVASGLVLNLSTDCGFETDPEILLLRLKTLGKSVRSFRPEEVYAA